MRKQYLTLLAATTFTFLSCSDSASDEFEEVNGEVEPQYITSTIVTATADPSDRTTLFLSYDENMRLTDVSNGEDTDYFIYEDDELVNVTGQNDNLDIEELYQSPYNAFEVGEVREYDANGNPKRIAFYSEDYDHTTGTTIDKEYMAVVSYDDAPNPYFYTLKAAGIIEVLDGVQLHLTMTPQASEVVKARALLFNNNPSQVVYFDENGETLYDIKVDYSYNDLNYPTQATIKATNYEQDGAVDFYTATFSYLN
ncbi:hypothetical protein ACFSYG_09540 [Leeuwenhoekiella polynyae]|uniref:YD repeat-containing protein n=1 Tax=Leeuwenhoekiella polynyae TaxID=1550906 RepID=A0A4Q0PH98_9FLAO|nr:hypothetical protein [Leeuwenhoekiella polynyae]RXG26040.1 hypothetical protein DSM02_31 [Leeuwenhoekiella polynyae]